MNDNIWKKYRIEQKYVDFVKMIFCDNYYLFV